AVEAAGLLGGCQRSRNERLGPAGAAASPVTDAADSGAQGVVGHCAGARGGDGVLNFPGGVRSGRVCWAGPPPAQGVGWLRSSATRPRRASRLLSCLSNRAVVVKRFLSSITFLLCSQSCEIPFFRTLRYPRSVVVHAFLRARPKPAPCWPERSRGVPSTHSVSGKPARQDSGLPPRPTAPPRGTYPP